MTVERGEIWLADLNPTRGSEQGGTRPVIIFQNEIISQFSSTNIIVFLTSNLRRASLPSCLLISAGGWFRVRLGCLMSSVTGN